MLFMYVDCLCCVFLLLLVDHFSLKPHTFSFQFPMTSFSLSLFLPPKPSAKLHQSSPKKPPPHRLKSLLEISRTREELSQIHSLLIKTSLIQEPTTFTQLLYSFASLAEPDSLSHACRLFENPGAPRNTFIYNSLIRFYSRAGDPRSALLFFSQMLRESSASPDDFTYTFVCNACSKCSSLRHEGRQVHALMVKSSARIKTHSWNSLMGFYIKSGEDLRRVGMIVYEMEEPDIVSWNCLLDGYVKAGDLCGARNVFDEMPERDVVSWTTMLVGYSNAGLLREAHGLFDGMPYRSMVSWTAMINGYLRAEQYQEALALFEEMQTLGVRIDHITLTTLLSVCARIGALDQGQWIHAYIDRHRLKADAHLRTALVDMYGKCGRIDLAYKVFEETKAKKVFLWNAMLGALAMHSLGKRAVELFSAMLEVGAKPNEITFICVLSACSHSGLVKEGLRVFHSMEREHKVTPTVEHYGCIVDLLGRAGLLADAKRVVEAMPMGADANVWRALLSACRVHGNVQLGEEVGRALLELEPLNDGNYILLLSIYAMDKRWEEVGELRKMMAGRGVRKTLGCSSIEVNGVVHAFAAGDHSHCQSSEIYALLNELTEQICNHIHQIPQ